MGRKLSQQSNEKIEFWSDRIKQFNKSGLSCVEYCRQNNLSKATFHKLKRTISYLNVQVNDSKEEVFHLEQKDFIKIIPISNTEITSKIELVVKNIFRLKLKTDFDSKLLKQILKTLGCKL